MNDEDLDDEQLEEEEEILSFFGALEKEYHETMLKMQTATTEVTFQDEYSKLFDAFEKTYINEQELLKEKENLTEEKKMLDRDFDNLKETNEMTLRSIERLDKDLEHAHRLADNAHAREQQAQEVIENMRVQIVKLNNELEQKSKAGGDESDE